MDTVHLNNLNKSEHLNDPSSMCTVGQSEMHQKFQSPILKKTAVTRVKRLEQFLWHEFYDEYIRSKQRLEAMRPGTPTSEYFDEFGKCAPHLVEKAKEKEEADERLVNRFPLYSTNAISVWNPKGEFTCNFRKNASITIPTSLQRRKFDD